MTGDIDENQLPRLAIRPYPQQYAGPWMLRDGTAVMIRPIRPDDEPLLAAFHEKLSEVSVYQRYLAPLKLDTRVDHDRLARQCSIDYDHEIALVVICEDPSTGEQSLIAVGRLTRLASGNTAEFALLVGDAFQRQGLGRELMQRLLAIGRAEGIAHVIGYILPYNHGMLCICTELGAHSRDEQGIVVATFDL